MTEKKQVYHIQIVAKTASVNLDNIEVEFNSITMKNEDEDVIVFSGREYDIYKERCSDGVLLNLYIVNDGNTIQDRIDYLIDEEYLISSVDIMAKKISSGEVLETELLSPYGVQTEREIAVKLDPKLEGITTYLIDSLTEGNQGLKDIIFKTLREEEDLVDFLNPILNLPIL